MLHTLRQKLTYANVMATVAVFVALGGSSYAALRVTSKNVPKDALTGADIKNLTGKDVRNESLDTRDVKNLLATDFKAGQLPAGSGGGQGAPGQGGATGTTGTNGATGARGPSDGYYNTGGTTFTASSGAAPAVVASLTLPAGAFVATAAVRLDNQGGDMDEVRCKLILSGVANEQAVYLGGANPTDIDVLAMTVGNSQGSGGPAQVTCFQNGGTLDGIAASANISAVQVETLHIG